MKLDPIQFWQQYKSSLLRLKPTRSNYHSRKLWTAITREAATAVIQQRSLTPIEDVTALLTASNEYMRVDVIGAEVIQPNCCNWVLRVAFEHENEYSKDQWIQELCKLTHVVADLRVLAGYYDCDEPALREKLQRHVALMEEHEYRMSRVPNSQWLFIFGPAGGAKERSGEFVIYTLDHPAKIIRYDDTDPLRPADWPL